MIKKDPPSLKASDHAKGQASGQGEKAYLILNDIRSVYNVGSIFRTADALALDKIFLVGITPTPLDRFGNKRKDLAKVALGAENSIDWEEKKDLKELIADLKKKDFKIVCVEQDKNSKNYKNIKVKEKTAFIFGNEVEGLPKEILKKSDTIAEIPMKGNKESLNVSVTVGIILFSLLD